MGRHDDLTEPVDSTGRHDDLTEPVDSTGAMTTLTEPVSCRSSGLSGMIFIFNLLQGA
jgi:hypothetical protein